MDHATSGLLVGRLRVAAEQVVFVKGVVEASEGLAALFAERGGDLRIASPLDREAELRELLADLATDLGGSVDFEVAPPPCSTTPSTIAPQIAHEAPPIAHETLPSTAPSR